MRNSSQLTLALFVFLCPPMLIGGDDDLQVTNDNHLGCAIQSESTCELGKSPKIKVEITNRTKGDIYLVGSLDASDCQWRYPHCYFEVTGPDRKLAVSNIGCICGNMNPLREKDFVKVPPGGKFDPYEHIDDYGFFSAYQLYPGTFRVEGNYRIRFVYSTEKKEFEDWLGNGKTSPELVKLLAQVPKKTIMSNEVTLKIVRPK